MFNKGVKFLARLARDQRVIFTAIRYLTTAAIAIELLIYARLLGPQSFGNYALVVQIVGFLLLVGAGSGAGYVYVYFKSTDPDLEYIYLFGSLVQYLGGAVFLVIAAWFSGSYLLISSLLLLLQIPYLISEPMLRVRNCFTLPAIGRASGSIATIIITGFFFLHSGTQYLTNNSFQLSQAVSLMVLGNVVGYGVYYWYLFRTKKIEFKSNRFWAVASRATTLSRYWREIIYPHWLYVVSSIFFVAFTYIDRLFLEAYYDKTNLSTYSLAWQVAQSVLLLLNSLNIISGVRIGESQLADPQQLVRVVNKQLRLSAIAGSIAFLTALLSGWLLNLTLYKDYEGLLVVVLVLSLGYLSYGIVGSVTTVLLFSKRYLDMILATLSLLFISLTGNIVSLWQHWNYFSPIAISSLALVFSNLFLLRQIQKAIR